MLESSGSKLSWLNLRNSSGGGGAWRWSLVKIYPDYMDVLKISWTGRWLDLIRERERERIFLIGSMTISLIFRN